MLTIDLIPKSCWYSNVRSEVSKDEWDKIKSRVSRKANYKCEICGGRGPRWPVECHEIWAFDEQTRVQKLVEMTALCPDCHRVKHYGLAQIKGWDGEAREHLGKVNGWTEQRVEKHIARAFEIWRRRSALKWELDIDVLGEYR